MKKLTVLIDDELYKSFKRETVDSGETFTSFVRKQLETKVEKKIKDVTQELKKDMSKIQISEDVSVKPKTKGKKVGRTTSYGIALCEHDKPIGEFCEKCGY